MFDPNAAVGYDFNEDYLVTIVVTFLDQPEPASSETFAQTQALLVEQFGSMPEPEPTGEHLLESAMRIGPVSIRHLLRGAPPMTPEGSLVEQIILYGGS